MWQATLGVVVMINPTRRALAAICAYALIGDATEIAVSRARNARRRLVDHLPPVTNARRSSGAGPCPRGSTRSAATLTPLPGRAIGERPLVGLAKRAPGVLDAVRSSARVCGFDSLLGVAKKLPP